MTSILVIEDEVILRDEVVEWLTLEDYEAFSAADGLEGLDAAFHRQPDLIVCDITMPRLDGYGVLLELHSHPATADIPFIFVTARAAHDDIRQGMRLGADDYLTKPFTRLELLDAIETRLQKRAQQAQNYQEALAEWQQAFEQEREQRVFKAKLVGMFSHDFRNPLASIIATNDLLSRYGERMDAAHRQSHFERIEASAQQLLHMLDDLLLVAQMESGHLAFQPESLDVGSLMQAIVDDFQAIHRETHQLVFENRWSGTTWADQRLLRQIGANLISNAIKYSPRGGDIWVGLDGYDGHYRLIVQDQGIGIAEADQQRLFAAFQRGSNVGGIAGTGLGLVIVKQAVDLHGGTIQVVSEVGKGTTFVVEFPIVEC